MAIDRVAVVVPPRPMDEFNEVRAVPGVVGEEARYRPVVGKLTDVSLLGIYLAVHMEMDRRAEQLATIRPRAGRRIGR